MLQLNPDKGLKNNKHEKQTGLSFKIKTKSLKKYKISNQSR